MLCNLTKSKRLSSSTVFSKSSSTHITKRVNIPSYLVKVGDVIAVAENSKDNGRFKLVKEEGAYANSPKWLESNASELTAKVVAMPERDDIDYPVEEHLIVEFYSK